MRKCTMDTCSCVQKCACINAYRILKMQWCYLSKVGVIICTSNGGGHYMH